MQWIFGFGLVGLGGFIDFKELRQAGGTPLKLGLIVGVTKYVLALVVVSADQRLPGVNLNTARRNNYG